ncbi:hypothetical protein Xcel_1525 [Xylanimonas cellulosilytica DSM 15894]|uniref:DUF5979 domain-containing protein n=1 Tax=Xylanimonas cellulosilytica (strain DSM 15894 / JCM 12276 / CECT 5975 / KCTC 9989 / LMG 20990 / NBRC 107835 / XIL07) TaxID=446471 RepID=D1BS63_XYLCX|nr:DUF5979 domain-containing protein [Xylanimonas cellulosilytica]ACZ30555.1 hypothetical protein Xcel_1525 [Xylanimonas cellulosilytica DSM 15894]
MTSKRHARKRKLTAAIRRAAGAATAVALALGGLIVTEAAAETSGTEPSGVVWSLDFEGSTINNTDGQYTLNDPSGWITSGNPILAIVNDPEAPQSNVLQIEGDFDYTGIQSPQDGLEEGTTYQFSMRVRLAEDRDALLEARFVAKPCYEWVGNTALRADKWTTIRGAWTAAATHADCTSRDYQVYLGFGNGKDGVEDPFSVLVDDIVVREIKPTIDVSDEDDNKFVPGDKVTLSGTDLGAGEIVALSFEQGGEVIEGGSVSVGTLTDAEGTFSDDNVVLPTNVTPGPLTVIARTGDAEAEETLEIAEPAINALGEVARKTTFTVQGGGFIPGSHVDVTAPSVSSVRVHADDEGNIDATLTAPVFPTDALVITATGAGSPPITAISEPVRVIGNFDDGPSLDIVDDYDVVPGDVVTAYGTGFEPYQDVQLSVVHTTNYFQTITVTPGADGTFAYPHMTFPNYWEPGVEMTVNATQAKSTLNASTAVPLATPAVQAAPATVAVGDTIAITGSGFRANVDLQVWMAGQSWHLLADEEGRFEVITTVPQTLGTLTITSNQWGPVPNTTVQVVGATAPIITASAATVIPGNELNINGKNFASNELVTFKFEPSANPGQAPTTLSDGSFESAKVVVPEGAQPGTLTITATGQESRRVATTTVEIMAAPKVYTPELKVPDVMTVTAGVLFAITGSDFPPRANVTLEFVDGAEVVGSTSVRTDSKGRFTEQIAVPYGTPTEGTYPITIRAVGYTNEAASTSVEVIPPQNAAGTISIEMPGELDETVKPGTRVTVNWEYLTPGHLSVTMLTADPDPAVVLGSSLLVVGASGQGSGTVAIPDDVLTGETVEWEVTITASQGGTSKETRVTIKNDFDGYRDAYDIATGLVTLRTNQAFAGLSVPWSQLDHLITSNDFIDAGKGKDATQAISDQVEAQLRDAVRTVMESILEARLGDANKVLAAYAEAAAKDPTMTAVLAGAARDLVDSEVSDTSSALERIPAKIIPDWRVLQFFDFEVDSWNDGVPSYYADKLDRVQDPRNTGEYVGKISTENNWEGFDLDPGMANPGETCQYEADVMYEGPGSELDIRFLAKHNGNQYTWIGNKSVRQGEDWVHLNGQWTLPAGGAEFIRLVPGKAGDDTDAHTFYADNIKVSCYTEVIEAPEQVTDHATLLARDAALRDAIQALWDALAVTSASQKPWSPPSGLEPGWVYNNGSIFTDGSIARWIGGNLYIRGDSSELEGGTVVINDLDQNKTPRDIDDGKEHIEWSGFNYGQVTIGSHIDNGPNGLALAVCGNSHYIADPSIKGFRVDQQDQHHDGINFYEIYCDTDAVDTKFKEIMTLSTSLGARSYATGAIGGTVRPERNATLDGAGTLTLSAGVEHLDGDGLYVFTVNGVDLAGVTKLVIEGLQTSDPAKSGRILSMKPAVINVLGEVPIEWNIEEIYLADDKLGYEQIFANGNNAWHQDLGIVAGALMWNFPEAQDNRGPKTTAPVPNRDELSIALLGSGDPGKELLPGGLSPSVTIRTDGLGLNFLGSLLIPYGSLKTVNVSLNGRQYVGGDWLMDDIYEWVDEETSGCPIYFQEGGFPDARNNVCTNRDGVTKRSLLGHAEGHNYPWWFSPVTAGASGGITITKEVLGNSLNDALRDTQPEDMYAVGELRCMHVENVARFGLNVNDDEWWDGHEDSLKVNATWWVKAGTEGITLPDVPYGALCTITERPGMHTSTGEHEKIENGMYGFFRESAGKRTGIGGGLGFANAPDFSPVALNEHWAWAIPTYSYDDASRPVFVTSDGPTASFLLTANTSNSEATITNTVTEVGSASIRKLFDKSGLELAQPTEVKFRWTAAIDGYVKDGSGALELVPGSATGDLEVNVNDDAEPTNIQVCTDGDGTNCQQLWFPHGTEITWDEVDSPFKIGTVWYQWHATFAPARTIVTGRSTVDVTVTNTAVKVPLSFSLQKVVKGTGTNLVPKNGEFTVSYEAWIGDVRINNCAMLDNSCEDKLTVRTNGTIVTSAVYPEGTYIVLKENPAPTNWGVTWGDPEFSDNKFHLRAENAPATITLTNTAIAPAVFSVYKALSAFDRQALSTSPTTESFTLTYQVNNNWTSTFTVTSNYGNDSASRKFTDVKVGDVVTVWEETGPLKDTQWKEDLVKITFWQGNKQLESCEERGFATSTCADNAFTVTAENSNLVSVRVTNASQAEPAAPVMPMTGGQVLAWLGVVTSLVVASYLNFRRTRTGRRTAPQGGAMR